MIHSPHDSQPKTSPPHHVIGHAWKVGMPEPNMFTIVTVNLLAQVESSPDMLNRTLTTQTNPQKSPFFYWVVFNFFCVPQFRCSISYRAFWIWPLKGNPQLSPGCWCNNSSKAIGWSVRRWSPECQRPSQWWTLGCFRKWWYPPNHPFWGTPIFGNTHLGTVQYLIRRWTFKWMDQRMDETMDGEVAPTHFT